MSAATFEDLMRVQYYVERAIARLLTESGIECLITRTGGIRQAPCVVVAFERGAQRAQMMPDKQGKLRRCAWDGIVTVDVLTSRKKDVNDDHSLLAARVSKVVEDLKTSLNSDLLPYHAIVHSEFTAEDAGIKPEDDCDITTLTFDVVVYIRPSAWPEIAS